MGQAPLGHTICCSLREKEKYDASSGFPVATGPPQFYCIEVQIELRSPRFIAFAPLWQKDNMPPRRLAIATKHEVHVYLVAETELPEGPSPVVGNSGICGGESTLNLRLEHSMALDSGMEITSMIFGDECSSKSLVVATAPSSDLAAKTSQRQHQVRFFNCETQAAPAGDSGEQEEGGVPAHVWKWDTDYTAELEEHGAPVTHLVTSQTTLVSADRSGTCGTWQKSKGFSKRHASARLHKGSIADISVDRFFVYTCGREDKTICIWSVPDLQLIMECVAEVPKHLLGLDSIPFPEPSSVVSAPADDECAPDVAAPSAVGDSDTSSPKAKPEPSSGTCSLSALTALRRPLSRWAGSQGSSRSAKAPKGTLFIAGVLAEQCDAAGVGAGILMEYALAPSGEKGAICQSAQIAHDCPIAAIAYGPYDNGPVITADVRGVFRVWDCCPRLTCSQHLEFFSVPGTIPQVSMAVEPQRGLYSSNGDRRLFVWRRSQSHEFLYNTQ